MESNGRRFRMAGKLTAAVLVFLLLAQFGLHVLAAAPETEDDVYLLVGYDAQEGDTAARSDTMILCRFDKEAGQLILVSLLRDLYVPIPGHGKNRLNAAYALGGAELLEKTGCIEVDFSRFSQIIDLLGGVELELREDEAALIGAETGTALASGEQRLSGAQALSYARIRCLDRDGDFSRTKRQRILLKALWEAYKDCSLPDLIRLMKTLAPMLRMNLESGSLLHTAVDMFPHISDMELRGGSIPAKNQCRDVYVDGMAVLQTDLDAAGKLLKSYLRLA